MTDPNSMTGYDAADGIADKTARQRLTDTELNRIAGGAYCFVEPDGAGFDMRDMAIELIGRRATIAALPIAPPAPLQVTADDVALIDALRKAVSYYRANDWPESDTDLLTQAADALARRTAPAVDETELDRLREALRRISEGATGYLDRDSDLAEIARAALNLERKAA